MFQRQYRTILYGLCGAIVAALALYGAYTLGSLSETLHDEEHMKELERENARLRHGEEDAAVDRRVSEQMAEIARDQRLISDAQRDSAEKQRRLADELREEAQRESRAAREAEARANSARREAEAASVEARRERTKALQQEQAALRSKRETDTLRYRDLARLLGSRSLLARENGNDSLARKLAYTAWYFLKNYGNNIYQPEVFQALGYDDRMEAASPHHSAIYDVDKSVDGKSCIVCSGYGEVLRWKGGKVETIFFDKRYDLRSMVQEQNAVWVLSHDGHLLHISATGKQQQTEDHILPEGEYFHLQDLPEGRLLAGARHQVVIFDIKTRSVITVRPFPEKRLLTTMPTKKEVFFFYDNGTIGCTPYSTKRNSEVPSPVKEPITAAHYDEISDLAYVGCASGRIYVLKKGGVIFSRLLGHSSSITDFTFMPELHLMLSTGRDKELHIWDVDRIRAGKPVESTRHKMDSWPLSLAPFGSRVVCGLVNGKLIMWEFAVDKLAQATRNRISSGLNENEWNTFVGAKVDYVKLK